MKQFCLTFLIICCVLAVNAQVVINEVCATNADINIDPDFFNFSPWIELYNKGNSTVDIGGYYISDDAGQKDKWRIPSGTTISAHGYKIIWCDGKNTSLKLHTGFSLDSDGEQVVLSNNDLTEVDNVTYPKQHTNISYGRIPDGGSWGYLNFPTPLAANNESTGTQLLANPDFSLKSGRYTSSQILSIAHPSPGVEIRYTIDGSEPTRTSSLYSNPFSVDKTVTIKAKAFLKGFLNSKTEVKTFFINEHLFTLPVVSISTNTKYLWDNSIGIYTVGTNGITGNCVDYAVNWNQDWDRHAVFEYFDKTGEKFFDQGVDIRIGGGCSRDRPQKSLVVRARDKYGDNILEYDFFKTKNISQFGGFVLRNGGNDFGNAMFRDALMQSLMIGQMDVDYLAYQPSIVYLNGNYWGLQNLREKIDGDYIESNYGIKKDDIDLIETYGNALEGSSDRYSIYLDSLQKVDLSSPEAFAFINRYIDVQEFINYLTAEIYYCNTDWPGNNVKFWRQRSTNGKFRWILWDMDFGFGLYESQSYATHPTLDFATAEDGPQWPNPPWSTFHIRMLLKNPDFRNKFLQTLTTSLSTTYKPERVIAMINEFQKGIKDEMPYHIDRWDLSEDGWNYQVERLRVFARERNEFMKGYIGSFFGKDESVRFYITASPQGSGAVAFNGVTSDLPLSSAHYYKGVPFEIKPSPAPGFKFSHYRIKKQEVTSVPLVAKGEMWKYWDQGNVNSEAWADQDFSDGTWSEGEAELGYGDGNEITVLNYGPDAENKFVTTYFRKTLNVSDTAGMNALSGNVLFDDGVVVYLNGEEVYRGNMPGGEISYSTYASQATPSEITYTPFTIPRGKIKPGNNVIAVEVHQSSGNSSDISFDFQLSSYRSGEETEYESTDALIEEIANSDVHIEAYFEPVAAQEGIIINEVCASNSLYADEFGEKDDWIELYNNGNQAVDLAGFYITDNLNNKTKFRISAGKSNETVIQPGEYKILWADENVTQGALHLNFKLSADGEEVGIYQMEGLSLKKVDEVIFDRQIENSSFSRIPNLTGPFLLSGKATPLAVNEFEIPTSSEDDHESGVRIYPNPASSVLTIESTKPAQQVKIYNASGAMVRMINNLTTNTDISIEEYSPGLYTVVLYLNNKVVNKRIIIHK